MKKDYRDSYYCGPPTLPPVEPPAESPRKRADDIQEGGSHYKDAGLQPWTVMEQWMTHEEFCGFLKGNVIKYLYRAGRKGDALTDVRKASHYLQKLIEVMECNSR